VGMGRSDFGWGKGPFVAVAFVRVSIYTTQLDAWFVSGFKAYFTEKLPFRIYRIAGNNL